eukprot:328845-Pleurochrysis_carterae.AAC.7
MARAGRVGAGGTLRYDTLRYNTIPCGTVRQTFTLISSEPSEATRHRTARQPTMAANSSGTAPP